MIDGKNFFDEPVKSDIRIYENIWKIETDQGNDYATGCLLEFLYFKQHYKLIVIDFSKQQALDPKEIQQINFTGNLDWAECAKETILDLSQGTVTVLWKNFCFNKILI